MMNKVVFILLVILVTVSCRSTKKYNESVTKVHTKEELIEDVDFLVDKLEQYFPSLYGFTTKENFYAKVEAIKADLKPMTSQEFFLEVYPLVSEIKQGHLALRPVFPIRDRKERKRYNRAKSEFGDIDFKWIDNGIYVENTYGDIDSLLLGSRLVKIDSLNADEFLNEWRNKIASDGYNTTFQPQILADRILTYYRYQVGRTDSIMLQLQTKDSLVLQPLRIIFEDKTKNEKKADTVTKDSSITKKSSSDSIAKPPKKLTKAEKKEKKKADKLKRQDNWKKGYNSKTEKSTREFRYIGQDSSIAYLRIRSFRGWYKWSKKFYNETFATIDSLGSKHLILDLRDNTGGSLREIGEIYSYLAKDDFTFLNPIKSKTKLITTKSMWSGRPSFVGHITRALATPVTLSVDLIKSKKADNEINYKNRFSNIREPNELAFDGEIYVLTNGLSFSASSILSTNLQGSKRATFIGEETGGAYNGTVAGVYQTKYLPNTKLFLPLWMMNIDATYKKEVEGYGIKPDIVIEPKLEDLMKGKDTILEYVIEKIEKN